MNLTLQNSIAFGIIAFGVMISAFLVVRSPAYAQEIPSGSQIVCEVYEYLVSQGLPIPPGLDTTGCEGNGGGEPPTPGNTQCSNMIDDDGDGLIDFLPGTGIGDPDCANLADNSEGPDAPPAPICADGLDNDEDGLVDLADPGCADLTDTDETDPVTPAPACADGIDNDGDSLVDSADPGCTGAADTDETDTPPGGGNPGSTDSSGGGNSGGCPPYAVNCTGQPSSGGGSVLGTTTAAVATSTATTTPAVTPAPISCDWYLTEFIKSGKTNDVEQVKRLQSILKDFEGAKLEVNGEYDAASLAAVQTFQAKYASEVLTPWGIEQPTGYVFLTTRKKLNEVYCKSAKQFPLTAEEEMHITKARVSPAQEVSAATEVKPSVPKQVVPKADTGAAPKGAEATKDAETDDSAVTPTGNRLGDFFRRLFDRF